MDLDMEYERKVKKESITNGLQLKGWTCHCPR